MRLILDTNIFVAAGFNKQSSAAVIIAKIRAGEWTLVWDETTRRETKQILNQIPPLSWAEFAPLFEQGEAHGGETRPHTFRLVADADDRKFAALAAASGAILVTNDDHLLAVRDQLAIEIVTARELAAREA